MAFVKYLHAFCRLLTVVVFFLSRFVYTKIQETFWRFNGTYAQIQDSRRPESYDSCVQVLDVVLSYRLDMSMMVTRSDYVTRHNRFDHPRYIFENDHVTLLTLDEEYAIFVEARQKGMHLWKTEYSGFLKLAQLEFGSRLLLVPLVHFHRMAVERGEPEAEIVFLFSTGRCGSTLLTQMMESTGRCVSVSEPDSFLMLWVWLLHNRKREVVLQMCRDVVRWVCRPYMDMNPLAYFLKITPTAISLLPLLRDVFPRARYLFMYRDVLKVAVSFSRVVQVIPLIVILNFLGRYSRTLRRKVVSASGIPNDCSAVDRFWDDISLGVVCFTRSCRLYQQFRRSGFPISAVRYEDLVQDSAHFMRRIFEYCDLPESLVEKSLDGLATDAQRNSPVSVEVIKRIKKREKLEFSADMEEFINGLLLKCGLPQVGEDCLLDGTITCRE